MDETLHTRYGHFKYLGMLSGLSNTPATFQYFINDILRDMLDQLVCIYLEDILAFFESQDLHNHHMCAILERLSQSHLYAKLDKCEFDKDIV